MDLEKNNTSVYDNKLKDNFINFQNFPTSSPINSRAKIASRTIKLNLNWSAKKMMPKLNGSRMELRLFQMVKGEN